MNHAEQRFQQLRVFLQAPPFNISELSDEALLTINQALTRSTFAKEVKDRGLECEDNERLEFLGDRVVNLVVAEQLFETQQVAEGNMTKNMKLVSNEELAKFILKKDIPIADHILLGTRESLNEKTLADAFEALVGAFYLKLGFDETKRIVASLFVDYIPRFEKESRNYVGEFQEMVLRAYPEAEVSEILKYDFPDKTGPDHEPVFSAIATLKGTPMGMGIGNSKKKAKAAAAKNALENIQEVLEEE